MISYSWYDIGYDIFLFERYVSYNLFLWAQ